MHNRRREERCVCYSFNLLDCTNKHGEGEPDERGEMKRYSISPLPNFPTPIDLIIFVLRCHSIFTRSTFKSRRITILIRDL